MLQTNITFPVSLQTSFFSKINIQVDSPVSVIVCSSCLFTKQIARAKSFADHPLWIVPVKLLHGPNQSLCEAIYLVLAWTV